MNRKGDMTTNLEPESTSGGGHEHRLHVHYNYSGGHAFKPEQICIATYDMRPGSQVSMHMHEGDCARCPNGHCHAANVTVVMTKDGELMLTFENFAPPQHVEGNHAGEQPRVITHQRARLADDENPDAADEAALDTFQIMRPAWAGAVDGEYSKEVFVIRAAECPNPADFISAQRATRPDVAVMKYLAEQYSLDLFDLCDRVQVTYSFDEQLSAFAVFYDVGELIADAKSEQVS